MNKIKVIDDLLEKEIDENIQVEVSETEEFLNVKKIIINVLKDSDLNIEYNNKNFKADIEINIKENVNFNLFELGINEDLKVRYNYNLESFSTLNIQKFYDAKKVNELDQINLNGEGANVNFILKTIALDKQTYNLKVFHNAKKTISNIINKGVNIEGSIDFNVEGIVENGIKDCELDQNNRIITFNDNICKIEPKLIISEDDVVANHSALIGKFNEDELFYLMRLGIDYNSAIILLVKGFLIDNIEDERLDKIIEKYWR